MERCLERGRFCNSADTLDNRRPIRPDCRHDEFSPAVISCTLAPRRVTGMLRRHAEYDENRPCLEVARGAVSLLARSVPSPVRRLALRGSRTSRSARAWRWQVGALPHYTRYRCKSSLRKQWAKAVSRAMRLVRTKSASDCSMVIMPSARPVESWLRS